MQRVVASVFVDGGVLRVNPSPYGGTWAAITIDESGTEIGRESGLVTPADIGMATVSNNVTELLAAVEALERLPPGWAGVLHTDSHVTRCRLVGRDPSMNGVPLQLARRMAEAKARAGRFTVVLLDGHPTKAQLASGIGKRGNACSKWNVECDRMCGKLAAEYSFSQASSAAGGDL